MTDPIRARYDLACAIAQQGGALALRYFHDRDQLVIEAKASAQDIVSRADREVEELIRAAITDAFPEDAILGEEGGEAPGTSGFQWVIDPIDGTSPYLAGLPHWCVIIALVHEGQAVAGVIVHPLSGDVYGAIRGQGAVLNDRPMTCNADARIDNSIIALGASHRTDPVHVGAVVVGLLRQGGIFYRNGSGGLMLAQVAAGHLGGYYEPHMNPWDCLAGALMVTEACGRSLPVAADPAGGLVLAAAPGVFDALQDVVRAADS
ncbi:MAG: inositol monophosphatase family protein [Paracoccus sp. (in: a-proteobacteria)]